MSKFRVSILAGAGLAAAALLASSGAQAATCVGKCGVSGANGDVTAPPGGGSYGWISTFGGKDGAGQIPSVGGTDGSSFTTTAFAATAGQNLHYSFNFISSDGQSQPDTFIYEDYAFVELIDLSSGGLVTMLFNARTEPAGLISPGEGLPPVDAGVTLTPAASPIIPGSGAGGGPVWAPLGDYSGQCWGAGCGYTGWIRADYVIPKAGDYQLVFGVTNWGDTIYDTGLAYSGIQIGEHEIGEGVPEPGLWAMMLLGFAAVGSSIRSRRLRASSGPRLTS